MAAALDTSVLDTSLRGKFLAAQFEAFERRLEETEGIIDDVMLAQLEKMASEGGHDAQTELAALLLGNHVTFDDYETWLEESQLNKEAARYWALQASEGEGYEAACAAKSEYVSLNLARILVQFDDDQCKLRALTLIIRAASSKDVEIADEVSTLLQDFFKGFNLEQFIAAYKAPPPAPAPAKRDDPQVGLF